MKPITVALLALILLFTAACSDSGPLTPDAESKDQLMPAKQSQSSAARESGKAEDSDVYIPSLEISNEFSIAQPDDGIITELDKYFITGTSSPSSPLYFGKEILERDASNGLFGVHVELKPGENTFSFTQEDETKTVTITRKEPKTATMGVISQSSMVPRIYTGAKVGEALKLGCIGPAGSVITASFAGEIIDLKQVEEEVEPGIAAFFTGELLIPDNGFAEKTTQNTGKVTYTLTLNGEKKDFESSGDVYVSGQGGRFAIRVENYMAFCYPDSAMSDLPFFCEKLKRGAADYVVSEGNSYVELANGGFVSKEAVKPLAGEIDISNKLLAANSYIGTKNENYTFVGTNRPAYFTELSDETFSITLYNTYGAEPLSISESRLFSSVETVSAGNLVNYTFTLKESLWGYTVDYNGKSTVLTFFNKPDTGSLNGVRVALDPGHGGTSPGAAGVAGALGPMEKDLNLAYATAVKKELEQKGAEVFLARQNDDEVDLDSRLVFPEQVDADLYISIHHNSLLRNLDANKISGAEVFYHTPMSLPLAERLMQALKELGREERFVEESFYRVTLNARCPAVMLELGYMSNPAEYETAVSQTQIKRFGIAAAKAIESLFT